MSLNIQTANGLLEIGGNVTKEKVISALGYEPADKKIETTVEGHTKDTDIHIASSERTLWNKNVENLDAHKTDKTVHVTSAERQTWNNKSDFSGAYADLIDAPNITENASGEVVYADESGNVIAKIGENGFETTQVIADTVVVNGVNVEEKFTQVNERIDNISIPSTEGLATEVYVDEAVAGIVNSAPETLDTLNELATALGDDPNFATTVATQIGLKADKTALDTHASDKVVHITADERSTWNAKSDFSGDYNDLENAPNIAEDGSDSVVYADEAGNIIAKIDANGFETTTVTAKSVLVNGTNVETALVGKADVGHTHEQYLEVSDISGKADKTYVNDEIASAITEAKTDASNKDAVILAETQKNIGVVQTALNNHTEDEDIHITNNERISWNSKLEASDIANKADKTELHNHSNKSELDKIVDGKVATWDAKSNFSGDYNDLTNAPNIYEDSSDNLVIADQNGNIIFRSDVNGFETTTLTAQTVVINGTDVENTLNGKTDKTYVDEAINEVKADFSNQDAVILAEIQAYVNAIIASKADIIEKITSIDASINITVADNTEYRFPNATTVNITCPDGEYECWIKLGTSATTVSISNAVCMTSCSLTPEDLTSGGGHIEISIKDGIYIIQKVE